MAFAFTTPKVSLTDLPFSDAEAAAFRGVHNGLRFLIMADARLAANARLSAGGALEKPKAD